MLGKSTGKKSKQLGTQTGNEHPIRVRKDKGIQVSTYLDQSDKATATLVKQRREMFPKITKVKSEVYLFMRGKKEFVQRLKNAFVRDKKVVANFGGKYLGISEDIQRSEGDLYRGVGEQCVIVIQFCDMSHAERWTQSSSMFKQKDFPSPSDEVEIFAVPVSYMPDEELSAFQLVEMHGLTVDPSQFQENYVKPVTELMNSKQIYHGVVASHSIGRLRNCMIRPDTFLLLNCADSDSKLKDFYDSLEYAKYKEYRQKAVAETDCCFFRLKSLTST